MASTVLWALLGCAMGNFAYHALSDRDWRTAVIWSAAQLSLAAAILLVLAIN